MGHAISHEGEFAIIKLSDRIEWEEARELDTLIKSMLEKGSYNIAFDLNSVTYICSAAIGTLVYNLNTARKNSGAIYIISSNEYIDFMFETLKFDMIFEGFIYPSYDEFQQKIIQAHGSA